MGAIAVDATPNRYSDQDGGVPTQKMQSSLDSCRLQIANHDTELKMFENKLDNFETILEAFNQQIDDLGKNQKDILKKSGETAGGKFQNLESTQKKMIEDLKKLQSHSNDASTSLIQSTQKLAELEKVINIQNQTIDQLKATVKVLMDLIQDKSGFAADQGTSGKTYKIQPGDNLEKIAKAQQTTVQKLKEWNGLTTDKIVVGKVLKILE